LTRFPSSWRRKFKHVFENRNSTQGSPYMSTKDRAAGAVMGALIGDALGVGPHWYYDLEEMRRDFGNWITGYTTPRAHRYHAGLKAGQSSQAGILTTMLL